MLQATSSIAATRAERRCHDRWQSSGDFRARQTPRRTTRSSSPVLRAIFTAILEGAECFPIVARYATVRTNSYWPLEFRALGFEGKRLSPMVACQPIERVLQIVLLHSSDPMVGGLQGRSQREARPRDGFLYDGEGARRWLDLEPPNGECEGIARVPAEHSGLPFGCLLFNADP